MKYPYQYIAISIQKGLSRVMKGVPFYPFFLSIQQMLEMDGIH